VYQPFEALYIVPIMNKASNILQDVRDSTSSSASRSTFHLAIHPILVITITGPSRARPDTKRHHIIHRNLHECVLCRLLSVLRLPLEHILRLTERRAVFWYDHLVLPSRALSVVRRPASQGLGSTVGEVEERGG
jgi:hypothetical protein